MTVTRWDIGRWHARRGFMVVLTPLQMMLSRSGEGEGEGDGGHGSAYVSKGAPFRDASLEYLDDNARRLEVTSDGQKTHLRVQGRGVNPPEGSCRFPLIVLE